MKMQLFLVLVTAVMLGGPPVDANERPNVLFIAVDDLRPELACYGRSHIHSPNIDRLASEGVLFERAYCMVATCGASRAALMTSVRPTAQRFVSYTTWAEKDASDALPLHTHFKNNGYTTISLGKVLHHKTDHVSGWSEAPWRSNLGGYRDVEAAAAAQAENQRKWPQKNRPRPLPFESFDADDDEYSDGEAAQKTSQYLRRFAESPDQPFFLAVGFLKPHLPFVAPKKYWDLYDREKIELPENYRIPTDVPSDAVHNSGELRSYAGIHPSQPLDRETAISLIHGYYACVSFTDAQVGRVLETLDETGLSKNTIVVLWGDHGWQLGEHGMWNKHSCFETSMHAPLIVKSPDASRFDAGERVTALTEFIDIYPSLCELAGLSTPSHVEGSSFVNVMEDPSRPGKPFAISRFGKGDTIRTDTMRYAEYTLRDGTFKGAMLFDHRSDPDEDINLVSKEPEAASRHATQLRANMGR